MIKKKNIKKPFKELDEIVTFLTNSPMNFSTALLLLKQGERVARTGWNGKNMWLFIVDPDDTSEMSLPYIAMRTADAQTVPWLASQTDILADDWVAV